MKGSPRTQIQQASAQVSPGAKVFYAALYRRFEAAAEARGGKVYVSIKQTDLARYFATSRRTIQRYEAQLTRAGWVTVTHRWLGAIRIRKLIFERKLQRHLLALPEASPVGAEIDLT